MDADTPPAPAGTGGHCPYREGVYAFLVRPRWLGLHLLTVVMVAACCWLGWWQLGRAQPNTASTQGRPTTEAPAPLADLVALGEQMSPRDAGRAVTVRGSWDGERQLLVPDRLHGRAGFSVIAPLVTGDGVAVTVQRGWTPRPGATVSPPPDGTVTVSGRLALPEGAAPAQPGPAALPSGQVSMISPALLINHWPYRLYDGYLTLPGGSGGLEPVPVPDVWSEPAPWSLQNLAYVAQWWTFAGAALFMWGVLVRREAADRSPGAAQT
ncbi:MAG: SURF1 family protein [Carbonactinosporaceae bacterium]